MEIIAQVLGIVWCTLCVGAIIWTIIDFVYITLKDKKL